MEETLQHQTTTQRSGLPPTGTGNHRPDGPKADHALTIKLDQSGGADQFDNVPGILADDMDTQCTDAGTGTVPAA
ncbi:MAG: hypothetical protein ABJN14_04955, partial [Paracoccaceae bacterium]